MICYCRLQQLGFSQFFTQCETTESDFLEANETCRQVALSANKYMLTLHEHLGSLSVFLVGSVLLIFVVFWVVLWGFFCVSSSYAHCCQFLLIVHSWLPFSLSIYMNSFHLKTIDFYSMYNQCDFVHLYNVFLNS